MAAHLEEEAVVVDAVRAWPSEAGPRIGRLGRHAPFLVAVAAGIAVRLVVSDAYRPALVFFDSRGYYRHALHPALSPTRPGGYSLVLRPILLLDRSLVSVTVFQHALGVLLAVACYAFLVRRGLPPWASTLAVLPVLLDPLQLVLEHYVLSDVVFEAFLVAACLLVLWRERPGYAPLVAAGAAVGATALTRGAGSFVLVVFLVAVACLRVGWRRLTAFALAALLPVVAYAVAFHEQHGEYALAASGPRFLYARLAPLVDCRDPRLELPGYETKLCPAEPVGSRPSSNYYMWARHQGPQYHLHVPPGLTELQAVKDFDKRVVRAQPLTYATATLEDTVRGFAPARTSDVPGYPARYWLFVDHYWMLSSPRWHPEAHAPTARFLQAYRQWLWTPGPLLGVLLVVAAAAALGLGRARRSGDRVAVGLLAGACLTTLLTGAAFSGFSWRYQLPQLPLLPVAGALGLAALVRGRAPGRPVPAPTVPVLDRAAAAVARLPGPWRPRLGRAGATGTLQWMLAVTAACLVGGVLGLGMAVSGWALPGTAALVGAGAGVLAAAVLVGARRRARSAAGARGARSVPPN